MCIDMCMGMCMGLCMDMCADMCAGGNSNYFDSCVNFVGSMHYWAPGVPIIFYDLGMQADELDYFRILKGRCFVGSDRYL